MSVVGVSLGGGRLAAVLINAQQTVLYRVWRAHRSTSYPAALRAVAAAVDECRQAARRSGSSVAGVGVAVAGPLSRDRARVLAALDPGFADQPMRQDLSHRLGVAVTLENDANATAVAEHRRGAGAGARCLLLMTLGTGTGIGGALVVGGQVLVGANGAAAEFGHLPVEPDGRSCACGARGCLEQYASGSAIADRAAAAIATGTAPVLAEVVQAELVRGARLRAGTARITSRHVVRAAHRGDPVATRLLNDAGERIGRALAVLAPAVDPDVVVLSGGLAHAAAGHLLPPIRSALCRCRPFHRHRAAPAVRLASCGPDAGAIGAAELARTRLVPARAVGGVGGGGVGGVGVAAAWPALGDQA